MDSEFSDWFSETDHFRESDNSMSTTLLQETQFRVLQEEPEGKQTLDQENELAKNSESVPMSV